MEIPFGAARGLCGGGLRPAVRGARRVVDQAACRGHGQLRELTSSLSGGWSLHYSNNPGEGHGGSGGFGDSGGPVISEDGYIVAVNSFVLNNNCNGAGFGYRRRAAPWFK